MALYEVTAGDPALAEDINQIIRILEGTGGASDTFGKTFSGSLAASTGTTIAHGLGRVPRLIIGFFSATSQANADSGSGQIHGPGSPAVANCMYFRSTSAVSSSSKACDSTNIYLFNNNPSSANFYRIYVI